MPRKPTTNPNPTTVLNSAQRRRSLKPPPGLTAEEETIFLEVADELSVVELSDHNLRLVAEIAQTLSLVSSDRKALAREGSVVRSPQGPKANPRFATINNGLNTVLRLRRALGLGQHKQSALADQRRGISELEAVAARVLSDPLVTKMEDFQPGGRCFGRGKEKLNQ